MGLRTAPDLAALTGVRSGKGSYYRELRRSNERLERTIRAMDCISRAVVSTGAGPRALIEEVVRAAATHLGAVWVVLVLTDGALPDVRPRFLAVDAAGVVHDRPGPLPAEVRRELRQLRAGVAEPTLDKPHRVRVPMYLDGARVGALFAIHGLSAELEPADLSVLRILANQAAVSMHSTEQYHSGLAHRRRAERLYGEAAQRTRELAARTVELHAAEERLRAADHRALLDAERNRIARELHDSVSQYVLSAGLTVDVCQKELAARPDGVDVAERLGAAKDIMHAAGEQLRSVIYALHHARFRDDAVGLPELLRVLADQHGPQLVVTVRVEGCPFALGTAIEHGLARIAGEALFNVSMHAAASRAVVRLGYRPDQVLLSVSDDGEGEPVRMRRHLRLSRGGAADGRHRGLANMACRAEELGGGFAIRRSRLGGIRIEVRLPCAAAERREPK